MPDITNALASRYPLLTDSQRERLEAAMLREIAAAITRGEGMAIIRPLPDGSFEISRFTVKHAGSHPAKVPRPVPLGAGG